MIHAIVFDIGGVILRTEDRSSRQGLEEKYGLSPDELDSLVFNSQPAQASTIGQESERAIWQNVVNELGLSLQALEEFKQAFWAGDKLDKQLIQFLQDCRPKYTTALLSNAWKDARTQLAEKYGITEGKTVDYILISSELGVAKPDPKIYRILSDTITSDFNEILFVDDFIENINAARELGIQAIHYQPGINLFSRIRKVCNLN